MRVSRRPEAWVFFILLGSYAFFWHSRDWNSASRLMLTYALVDRGTITLDGLDDQTGDKARFRGHYYTDKLPGFSLLATGPYALAKAVWRLPDHPLNRERIRLLAGRLLGHAGDLGPAHGADRGRARRPGARPGLRPPAIGAGRPGVRPGDAGLRLRDDELRAPGLGVRAARSSFALLWRPEAPRASLRMVLAGFLAAYAAVIELQVGPVSAILGLYLLAQVAGAAVGSRRLCEFAVGAIVPTLVLLGYNLLAFGSPWDMGYFHHATAQFAEVHNAGNPLGLGSPDWARARDLLWGGHRGLLFYAPIVALAVPGWAVLVSRRLWGMALVSASVVAAVFLVNLSYPEWTGGWSTGPRLLVPLLPFAMLPVAALLAVGGRWATLAAVLLALAGAVLMLLFQGVGARIPNPIDDPLLDAVLPLWRGDPLPGWATGGRFTRNAVGLLFPEFLDRLPPGRLWVQFLPLVAVQALAIAAMVLAMRRDVPNMASLKVKPSDESGFGDRR